MNKSFSSLLHLTAYSNKVSGIRSSEVKSITFGVFDLNLSNLHRASKVVKSVVSTCFFPFSFYCYFLFLSIFWPRGV